MKIKLEIQSVNPFMGAKDLNRINMFKSFNRNITVCSKKALKTFDSNYFCLNGRNCIEKNKILKGFKHVYTLKKVDCKCPIKKSFKCGQYCTLDSIACDFTKSKENKKYLNKIINCGNHNTTYFRSLVIIW